VQPSEELRAAFDRGLAHYDDVVIRSRTQTASGGVIQANIDGNFPVMTAFSGLFLIGTILVTAILLGRQVEAERQRIGTLRALGVTRHELVLHYLSFGLLIGVTGGLVGTIVGLLQFVPDNDAVRGDDRGRLFAGLCEFAASAIHVARLWRDCFKYHVSGSLSGVERIGHATGHCTAPAHAQNTEQLEPHPVGPFASNAASDRA
jgi:hypothetical protein